MKSAVCLVAFLFGFEASAHDYVMPENPKQMSQDDIQNVLKTASRLVPVGESNYHGIDPTSGAKCVLTFSLTPDAFQFPGANLGFGLGQGGDSDFFILVNNSIANDRDGAQTLDLAIISNGGFGDHRLVAYIIKSRSGIPIAFQTSAAAQHDAFQPGETIHSDWEVRTCNELIRD